MRITDPAVLSKAYDIRRLHSDDVDMIHAFCKRNTLYYRYCGRKVSIEQIESDLRMAPPGIPAAQKHYIGFFGDGRLTAVMDLIDGYPDDSCAYIGFFMLDSDLQGRGLGSRIISETLDALRRLGFGKCRLGIDKDNPQSNHFWRKNGFAVTREVVTEQGTILVAERLL